MPTSASVAIAAAEQVAVVFHDGFRPFREYVDFMQPPAFENVVFDIHRYQCFERDDIDMDIHGHIRKAAGEWRDEADAIRRELRLPTYVGEWSLGLDLKVVSLWAQGPFNHALERMDALQEALAYRAYAAAQLMTLRETCRLVFLELQDRNHAGLVFPRLRRAWLAAGRFRA